MDYPHCCSAPSSVHPYSSSCSRHRRCPRPRRWTRPPQLHYQRPRVGGSRQSTLCARRSSSAWATLRSWMPGACHARRQDDTSESFVFFVSIFPRCFGPEVTGSKERSVVWTRQGRQGKVRQGEVKVRGGEVRKPKTDLVKLVGSVEERFAHMHLDQNAPEAPHIDWHAVWQAQHNLWRAVEPALNI